MTGLFYIGFDGGGTRCRARLRDADGVLLGEGTGGPANVRLDPAMVWQSIMDAAEAARQQAGLDATIWPRAHAGLGLAGAGQPTARERLLARSFPFASITLDTDAYTAWLGACGADKSGAILIVGTGVCGFMEHGVQRISIGGWGSVVSDDGGGAVTGREAIRRCLKVFDGLYPHSGFTKDILGMIGSSAEAVVDWADKASPADFAQFAPLAYQYALQGDSNAQPVVEQAADAINRLTLRLVELGASRVHLLGGLASVMMPWLSPEARSYYAPAKADALEGAIMLAKQHTPNNGSAS